jgi:hypothetical protein
MQLAAPGATLYATSFDNLAPRVGIGYQVAARPGWETVFRDGFGMYYDLATGQAISGYTSVPLGGVVTTTNVPYPIAPELESAPLPPPRGRSLPYTAGPILAVDPDYDLPFTLQWSLGMEQSLGPRQAVSAAYVAAAGRDLSRSRVLRNLNSNFPQIIFIDNGSTSDYHSLQLQFQRRLSRGFQALASYTWSHAVDEVSFDSFGVGSRVLRGDADFDIRHNVAAALTYDLAVPRANPVVKAIFDGWSAHATFQARSAAPFEVFAGEFVDPVDGVARAIRPNLIPGVPIYLDDPNAPGGRVVNRAAFETPPAGQLGNLGRNVLRGNALYQVDAALQRQFKLAGPRTLRFRVEAFNVLNHPNFGNLNTSLTSPTFGQYTSMLNRSLGGLSQLYQIGGPRSLQFALKLAF